MHVITDPMVVGGDWPYSKGKTIHSTTISKVILFKLTYFYVSIVFTRKKARLHSSHVE